MKMTIQKIADYYGLDNQIDKTIEECAELIQALVKLEHDSDKTSALENVIKEMADVQIMLSQLVYLIDCEEEMKNVMEYKINRQLERIREEKERKEKIL